MSEGSRFVENLTRPLPQPKDLEDLIKRYEVCKLSHREATYQAEVTILKVRRKSPHKKTVKHLLPQGECILKHHIEFNEEEKEILRKYNITYEHFYESIPLDH